MTWRLTSAKSWRTLKTPSGARFASQPPIKRCPGRAESQWQVWKYTKLSAIAIPKNRTASWLVFWRVTRLENGRRVSPHACRHGWRRRRGMPEGRKSDRGRLTSCGRRKRKLGWGLYKARLRLSRVPLIPAHIAICDRSLTNDHILWWGRGVFGGYKPLQLSASDKKHLI